MQLVLAAGRSLRQLASQHSAANLGPLLHVGVHSGASLLPERTGQKSQFCSGRSVRTNVRCKIRPPRRATRAAQFVRRLENQPEFQLQLDGGARYQTLGPAMQGLPGELPGHLRRTSDMAVTSMTLGVVGLFPAICTLLLMIPQTSALLVASVVMGFVGLFLGVSNVFAIIFGAVSMKEIGRSNGYVGGWGMALAGLIMGAIGAVGWLFWILFWLRVLSLPNR